MPFLLQFFSKKGIRVDIKSQTFMVLYSFNPAVLLWVSYLPSLSPFLHV